jgi:hypothetical protein
VPCGFIPLKYVPDRAVLPGGVERLQHHQQGLTAVRIEQVLQLLHALEMLCNLGGGLLMALVFAFVGWIDL